MLQSLVLTQPLSAQRLRQKIGRGVVAVNRSGSTIASVASAGGQGNLISWRKLAEEPEGTKYYVYRRMAGSEKFTKLIARAQTVTNYKPTTLSDNCEYAISALTPDGVEGPLSQPFKYVKQTIPNAWFDFDFDNVVIPRNDYRTKFVWPMDTDGDGEVDAVVCDRLYASGTSDDAENQEDNTATTSHKVQAYRLTGELMWTVDMGPNVNICGGQNDMVVVWDINCDGKAEVMIKSSDGTRFWNKQSETWGKYARGSSVADVDGDGIVDYRTQSKRNPPFYVSVIDGMTGEEIASNELKYSEVTDGVDTYTRNNRADYMNFGYAAMDGHFAICYLDGIHPSLVMECLDRGTDKNHHNYVFTWDYDWQGNTPSNWHHSATWSRNDKKPWPAEFHQLRVADVNGDGCDEMIQGGYSVNPLKGWFQSPGIGHGDRFIISDIDPDRPGMEVYAIQQSALLGQLLYDAETAERIKEWYLPSLFDVGRGACMDVDASRKGYELYSFTDDYIYDCKGEKTKYTRSGSGINQIFEGVWWNGDLQREELSSPGGSNWDTNLQVTQVLNKARLIEFSKESSWTTHSGNGTRPAFMGDIIGDWREEVILAKQNGSSSTGLVGYTTAMPTDYSIYCLQQDPHYSGDCTTRGYYQHPNTSFYLGGGMPIPPLPPVFVADLRWKSMAEGYTTYDMGSAAAYADGKSVMFDVSGDNSSPITFDSPIAPSTLYVMNPKGHDYTFALPDTYTGARTLTTGTGNMIKSMLGMAYFNGDLTHTGQTIISEGQLIVDGEMAGPVELRAKGTLGGNVVLNDTITFEGALNYEGCRLMPGTKGNEVVGLMTSRKSMTLPGEVYLEITADILSLYRDHSPTLSQEEGATAKTNEWVGNVPTCSRLYVEGDLTFKNTNYITVNLNTKDAAEYVLAECTGTLTCDVSNIKTRGLEGMDYDLAVVDGKKLVLRLNESRSAQDNVTWTGSESGEWGYKAKNFALQGSATAFVSGDGVVFGQNAATTNITVNGMMPTNGVTFNGGTYTLNGEGGLSGDADLVVNAPANVTLNMKYSDYTGKTVVNGGMLTVPNFYDGGQKSALGAGTASEGAIYLNGGTLALSKDNMGTDRLFFLTDTATIKVTQSNSSLALKGRVSGTGYLIKDGAGQLNFTYGGVNDFAGLIVKQGIVAQGAWNSSFGKTGSPMVLAGGEVHQLDQNSYSTMPTFNHAVTVVEGTKNRIVGTSRGKIDGSVKGGGDLTVETRYVRCDVGLNFSAFEGTLTAKGNGGNFRLMTNVTDMSKATLNVEGGTVVSFMQSGSGNDAAGTLRIGTLTATAADANLGGSKSNYIIGSRNEDSRYAGLFTAAAITKVGTGTLTLTGTGSTSPITVNGGTLELSPASQDVVTTGLVTITGTGTGTGTGTITGTGTLQDLTMQQSGTTLCRLTQTGNNVISVKGSLKHNGDTILVSIPAERKLNVGDEITVYSVQGQHTGSVIVKVDAAPGTSYVMDASTLLTDGKLRVTDVITGIGTITGTGTETVDVYTTDGVLLVSQQPYAKALAKLPKGTYIIMYKGKTLKVTK